MTTDELKKTYITSDWHFFHYNIIKYTGRHEETVPEMNEAIIRKVLKSVPDGSILINLGDVSMCHFRSMKELKRIRKVVLSLKGKRELWLKTGNHDAGMKHAIGLRRKFKTIEDCWRYIGFDKIFTEDFSMSFGYDTVVFSHQPIYIQDSNKNIFNIHGHTHEKPAACITENNISQYRNVCYDWGPNHYKPIQLSQIFSDFGIDYKTSSHDKTNEKRPRTSDKSR